MAGKSERGRSPTPTSMSGEPEHDDAVAYPEFCLAPTTI